MNLPSINLDILPDMTGAAGAFGSMTDVASAVMDDRIIILMVYIYETIPPETSALL